MIRRDSGARERQHPSGIELGLEPGERRVLGLVGELAAAAAAAVGALVAWGYIHDGRLTWDWVVSYPAWIGGFTALWFVSAAGAGRFASSGVATRRATLEVVLLPSFLALGFYLTTFFVVPRTLLPRLAALIFIALATVLTWGWRTVWTRATAHPVFGRRVLVAGAGETGRFLAEELIADPSTGWRIVGFVDNDPSLVGMELEVAGSGVPVLGTAADLPELTERYRVGEIMLALREPTDREALAALMTCRERGVGVVPGLEAFEMLTGRIPVDHVGEHWYQTLPLRRAGGQVLYLGTKRLGDMAMAAVGLLGLVLLLPLLAPLIKLDSRGPVFHGQRRVGRNGRVFTMWKLRTMTAEAEPEGPLWAQIRDPRMTRVGRWLRRMRVDEMPQFWNVLKGEMSLVGPRPERPEFEVDLEKAIRFYRLRYLVKPGLTGWAALHHGYIDTVEGARLRLELDLYYIKHQSLGLDLQILLQTLLHVLTFRGR